MDIMPGPLGGCINKAVKCGSHFDRSVLCTQEHGVIAAMTNEVLEFGPGVGVGEGAALGLEDGADALVGRNHIKPKRLLFAISMMHFVVDSNPCGA